MKSTKGIYLAMTLLILAATVLPIGCSKEKDTPIPESNRWLDLLSVLPADDNTLKAVYLNGIEYCMGRMEQYPQIPAEYAIGHAHPLVGAYYCDEEEWKQTLGFTLEDVDQSIYMPVRFLCPTTRRYAAVSAGVMLTAPPGPARGMTY